MGADWVGPRVFHDTGNNANAPSGPDLAGNPRIVHSYVDMGAYEFQGGTGQGDFDGDGAGNGDERFITLTDFADAGDAFAAAGLTVLGVSFLTETGRVYAVEATDNLPGIPQVWTEFTNNIPGTGGPIVINDPQSGTNRVYRVRVGLAP